jgi:hypothetical protein
MQFFFAICSVYFCGNEGTITEAKGGGIMRYEPGAANLILAAARRARGLGHSYVGSAHLLIALSEEPGQLGLVLRQRGAEPELLRN